METKLRGSIARIENLLSKPAVQSRAPMATAARRHLIAQLFWIDRALTAVIDKVDPAPYIKQFGAHVEHPEFLRFIEMIQNKGCAGK
jgi:hypothetical protein